MGYYLGWNHPLIRSPLIHPLPTGHPSRGDSPKEGLNSPTRGQWFQTSYRGCTFYRYLSSAPKEDSPWGTRYFRGRDIKLGDKCPSTCMAAEAGHFVGVAANAISWKSRSKGWESVGVGEYPRHYHQQQHQDHHHHHHHHHQLRIL